MPDTEKAKMLQGDLYIASDETLTAERLRVRELLHRLNVEQPGGSLGSYSEIVRELPRTRRDRHGSNRRSIATTDTTFTSGRTSS